MRRLLLAAVLLAGAAGGKPAHHHAAAADDSAAAEEAVHVVKEGETIGGVANRAHIPRVLIEEANHLTPPYHLHAGQRLTLPRTRHHTVAEGETSFDLAMRYDMAWKTIATANGLKPSAPIHAGQKLLIPTLIPSGDAATADTAAKTEDEAPAAKPADEGADAATGASRHARFAWPLSGKVVRGYTPRDEADHHDGIDILAPAGTAVRAAAAGEVVFAGKEPQNFGRLVVIDHGNGWQSAYGFLARLTVVKGDHVKAHERVGLVGHSGKAPRDELHFEIRRENKPVDPMDRLSKPEKPDKPAETPAKKTKKAKKAKQA